MDARDAMPMKPDLLGFSLSWELDYANVLTMLERMGIPIASANRTREHPLPPASIETFLSVCSLLHIQVFGGGPVLTANPEPYAEFFDVILLGDGEGILEDFMQAMQAARGGTGTRQELLISLSQAGVKAY
eukprot:scaffold2451_cov44-Prasinocladus_malaysianus.AAC.1